MLLSLANALMVCTVLLPQDTLAAARDLLKKGDPAGAVALLEQHLKRAEGDAATLELFGQALFQVGRADEGAHWLDTARSQHAGKKGKRDRARIEKTLFRADPLAKRRMGLMIGLVRDLSRAADKLEKSGQSQRALQLYRQALPLADGDALEHIESSIRAILEVNSAVDLDAAGRGAEEGGSRPLISLETDHYDLNCNLEQSVVDLLAVTMEDIHSNYVDIYFDGNEKRAPSIRPKIRIHATWEDMAALWTDGEPSPGLGGWWSPGSQEIHTYDGRTRGRSLQGTLETLFHEASHQFMSAFAKGSGVPTWFNEGTACFFEGARAMTDGRVLWPDAATGRLAALVADLDSGSGPQLAEVLGYPGPGSYPGSFYSHGWGLVYFLQQWEQPGSMSYAYRPLYRQYLDEAVAHPEDSLELFEQIILGDGDPLGHADIGAFESTWKQWILNTVRPLHLSPPAQRRALRAERATRYLVAADRAAQERRPLVSEEDLLLRALGDLESVRAEATESGDLTVPILLDTASVMERLGRRKAAAAVLEQLLDSTDDGLLELDAEQYKQAGKRLEKLDRGNYALRSARSRMKTQRQRMEALLEDYIEADPPLTLRGYTLATLLNPVFEGAPPWPEWEAELRESARARGLLLGQIVALAGPASAWSTVLMAEPELFSADDQGVVLRSMRPHGRIHSTAELTGEYEVRGRLVRQGEIHRGTAHGLVVSGAPEGDWFIVGVDQEGHVHLWHLIHSGEGSTRLKSAGAIYLEQPIAADSSPHLAVRVSPQGHLKVTVNGVFAGETEMGFAPRSPTHAGVFVRDGQVRVEELVVEIFP